MLNFLKIDDHIYELSKEMFQAIGRRENKENVLAIISKVKEGSLDSSANNSICEGV